LIDRRLDRGRAIGLAIGDSAKSTNSDPSIILRANTDRRNDQTHRDDDGRGNPLPTTG
jgi:hypothetical protein